MSLELLARWRPLLAEVGDLGEALRAAIVRGDVVTAIAANVALRRARSALSRVEAPANVTGEYAELVAMRDVAELTLRAQTADAVMAKWLARQLPGDRALLGSALGVAVLADAMLPPVWDYDKDLVVLVGTGLEPVATVLADLGQRRIIVHDGNDATRGIVTKTSDELVAAIRTMTPVAPDQFVVRGAVALARAQVERIADATTSAISDLRIHRNTVHAFSKTWLEQGAANLPALAQWPSIAAIGDRFAGKPMVIVAPGPSLANNVAQLGALKGKAIITAFSHSLRPLIAAGIEPDLVITVDPQDVQYHFAGIDVSRMCLVNAATVHPSLFELPAARFLTLSANSAIDDWIFTGVGEDAIAPGGGSVATTAFSLALRWKCDPIVFVGLDLSFPGGNYYVATSHDGGAHAVVDDRGLVRVEGWSPGFRAMKAGGGPQATRERAIELPAWNGGTVPSSFMFSMFHRWFVERMRSVTGTRVFNCTEGGAFIEGMDHRALADVVPELVAGVDAASLLDDAIANVPARRRGQLLNHIAGYVRGLRRVGRLARRARVMVKEPERLGAVERELGAALKPLTFASLLAQREIELAHDVARREGSDYLAASAKLFETLVRVVDDLQLVLASALARTRPNRKVGHDRAA